jgi:hypothetical protein
MFEFRFGSKDNQARRNAALTQPVDNPVADDKVPLLLAEATGQKRPVNPGMAIATQSVTVTAASDVAKPTATAASDATKPTARPGMTPANSPDNKPGYFGYMSDPDAPLRPHSFSPRADLLGKSPRVLISPAAYQRMLLYVEIANKEVGWLGTVTFLLEQEVTATETELSVDGQNKLVCELLEKGDDAGVERVNRLRFWGHSHVRMGTSPSGTDESTMNRFGNEGLPWYIRGIFNKLGRGSFAIYYYDRGYRILDAPWAVWTKEKGIIMDGTAPSRFAGNSWYQSNEEQGNKQNLSWRFPASGLSILSQPGDKLSTATTLGDSDRAEAKPPNTWESRIKTLPVECAPSDLLREEVAAEFVAKVTERLPPIFKWFKWGQAEGQDGDGMDQYTIEQIAGGTPVASTAESTPVASTAGGPVASTAGGAPEAVNAVHSAAPNTLTDPRNGSGSPVSKNISGAPAQKPFGLLDWLFGSRDSNKKGW